MTSNLDVLLQVICITLVFWTLQVYEFTNPLLVIVSDMLLEVKISKHKETYVRVHCNMCRSIQTHHRGQISYSLFVKKNINICVDEVDANIRIGIAKSFPGVFPDALLSFSLSADIHNIDSIQLPNLLQYIINIHHIWLLLSC